MTDEQLTLPAEWLPRRRGTVKRVSPPTAPATGPDGNASLDPASREDVQVRAEDEGASADLAPNKS